MRERPFFVLDSMSRGQPATSAARIAASLLEPASPLNIPSPDRGRLERERGAADCIQTCSQGESQSTVNHAGTAGAKVIAVSKPSSTNRSCTTATRTSPKSNGRSANLKTVQLEMRLVYLRDENRTRGHALVVMVAYLLTQALRQCWRDIDLIVQEALDRLASLCVVEVIIGGRPSYNRVPTPRDDVRRLFEAAGVAIPAALPLAPARVATKQTLPQRRNAK